MAVDQEDGIRAGAALFTSPVTDEERRQLAAVAEQAGAALEAVSLRLGSAARVGASAGLKTLSSTFITPKSTVRRCWWPSIGVVWPSSPFATVDELTSCRPARTRCDQPQASRSWGIVFVDRRVALLRTARLARAAAVAAADLDADADQAAEQDDDASGCARLAPWPTHSPAAYSAAPSPTAACIACAAAW